MERKRLIKRLLHVGCGREPLPEWIAHFKEIRVDISPYCEPDYVRNMLDLHGIDPCDVVYCCHALEHLYPHEVPQALAEFRRVLNPGGAVIIVVPDLEGVKPDTRVLATCDMGPICGLDMFYGHHSAIPTQPYMAHHCGFIAETLKDALEDAGFAKVSTERQSNYNLVGAGEKVA